MQDVLDRLKAALADHYTVERELGAGGMATVYLAEDVKHHRKVAVKVLRPELAAVLGADRFLQEIEVTANLQHPHILPLFDSGEANSFLFYVMPYVQGESLREKLNRETQISVEEAVQITEQVAAALDYAHGREIVHRDIKPENVLLETGQAVVADFGIALAVTAAGGMRLTETGLSLGTPQYMSPEQATADKELTPRSDIYSLGCVLYEMLAGAPPHTGSSAQQIIAKIATEEAPPVTNSRKSVPLNVAATLSKALEKIPADRFATASEMAHALQDTSFSYGYATKAESWGSDRWKTVAVGTSALSVAALIVAGLSLVAGSDQTSPVARWEIVPFSEGINRPVGTKTALAPDGSSIVYAELAEGGTDWQLWLKSRAEADATPLFGTERGQNVTYSPDGRHIAFASGTEIKRRPIGDGPTVTLARGAGRGVVGLAWLDDGTIIYEGARSAIVRIPELGGTSPDTVPGFPDVFNIGFLGALPGSHGALIGLCPGGCYATMQLSVIDFRADTTRMLIDEVMRGWYVPGHLVYVRRNGAVFAAPFDLDALELSGPEVLLFEGVAVLGSSPEMAVGRDGTVIYVTGAAMGEVGNPMDVVWVDRSGATEVVDSAWTAPFTGLALSPTGDRVAVVQQELDGPEHIWIGELDGGPLQQLTFEGEGNFDPAWTPEGRSIVFASDRAGGVDIYEKPVGGVQNAELLLGEDNDVRQPVISADGEWLIYTRQTGEGSDVMAKPLRKDGDPVAIADMEGRNEHLSALSPNGRWLAYVGPTRPRFGYDVWMRAFPAGAPKLQVSFGEAGSVPHWDHSGRELFYRSGGADWEMVSVEVTADSTFVRGQATTLFFWSGGLHIGNWDVAPDGQRFIFLRDATPRNVFVVENFFEELKVKVGN